MVSVDNQSRNFTWQSKCQVEHVAMIVTVGWGWTCVHAYWWFLNTFCSLGGYLRISAKVQDGIRGMYGLRGLLGLDRFGALFPLSSLLKFRMLASMLGLSLWEWVFETVVCAIEVTRLELASLFRCRELIRFSSPLLLLLGTTLPFSCLLCLIL